MRSFPWAGPLLALALFATGCASMTPPRGPGMYSREMRRGAAVLVSHPVGTEGAGRRSVSPAAVEVARTRQALRDALHDVSGSTRRIADALSRLAASPGGMGGRSDGLFAQHIVYGARQLRWLEVALKGATRWVQVASEVDDPEMGLALLRLSGPRLEAALFGSMLLAAWSDFLNLEDVVLRQCPFYSVEKLYVDMEHVREMLEPSMRALSSLEPGRVEATAAGVPGLMGELTREFQSTREGVRVSAERVNRVIVAAQVVEMLSMVSTMRLSPPRPPPAAPAMLGVGLVMGADGVMMGTRVVVSAEWVEMMRRLVRAGVISVPVVSAAVRVQAGQVLMSQSHDELPRGVRDALGDSPEVRGMHQTGSAGAGMAEPPRHHVLPREHREWFEQRGFTGEMSIDQFCVEMEQAHHEAIHGGGNWRQGRKWPGEWNQMIMKALRDAEMLAGRMLTRSEVLGTVAFHMKRYNLPMDFRPWRGR
ncbi:hypothetical protein MEBOL_002517 [Melittangium boletus DSM 14713]|uniref:DUF2380 domain-containing protein n=1 Tax=Melittangium boletus DSM 14713 TaxID=1294270 RepID=A0A250ICX3_9BACT|nr:DUF2380 domain-containing protein [Melittangium boletus]ATB29068.1 hypothetical protein MEBOL_002517 [Melittangium boletus DSM 14713]